MKRFQKMALLGLFLLATLFIITYWCNFTIESATEDQVTSNLHKLPKEKTGLLLGTGKTLANEKPNAYFFNRIKAAVELFRADKIQYIIVSGDNSRKNYNEPEDMKMELIKYGIPAEMIFEDFAGFRTLDSVVRAKEIFGQHSFIIISQRFHNERAVFLAQQNGIEAYGYNAKDVNQYAGLKTNLREYLARVKVFWDFMFGVEPKFGGEKITIP